MDPFQKRKAGKTTLTVTQFGFGGGTLGDPTEIIDEARADATVEAAYQAGITHFDTAPWYGNGKSEHRLGHVLRNKRRESFTLSTKVGRVYFRPENAKTFRQDRWAGGLPFDFQFDYTRNGVLRSYEDSLMRLGLNQVDSLVIHDLDLRHHETEERLRHCFVELEQGRGFQALEELKKRGEIRAIGAGINHVGMVARFLERFKLDFFILAMPYNLLDQEALDEELPRCAEAGAAVIIGAVFASGILATGAVEGANYRYETASPEILDKTRKIEAVCGRHGVSVAAAALQFPLGHESVLAVIPGANSPEQVASNLEFMQMEIPSGLWEELKAEGLLRADAPVPASGG